MKFSQEKSQDRTGFATGECRGCEVHAGVDELGFCADCSAKLDRDLIRKRDWEYSVSAFGVSREKREELRREIIEKFGEKLELLAEDPAPKRKGKSGKKKRARKRR